MEILGIGPGELLLIFLIILLVLGPKDIAATARNVSKTIRRVVQSPLWNDMVHTSRELRDLPARMVREAGIEETLAEVNQTLQEAALPNPGAVQSEPSGSRSILPEVTAPANSNQTGKTSPP